MKITGQFDTDGKLIPFTEVLEVVQLGNTLRDRDGFVHAIKDDYGDWVSPNLYYRLGVKSKMKVEP